MDDLRGDDVIDSRDVIARLEELSDAEELTEDESEELAQLKALAEEAEGYLADWTYGETLIKDDYFTDYIKELIKDCYAMPKEMESGDWPWRHVTIDYEAAAEEAKQDYASVMFGSDEYWIRSC